MAMSFGDMLGIALIVIFFFGIFHFLKESIVRPAKYIAGKSTGVEQLIVKGLAAKEAYDIFKEASAGNKAKKSPDADEKSITKP